MWRGMLGDFDVEAALFHKTSIITYIVFQALVVVLMMNLIIAIMGGTSGVCASMASVLCELCGIEVP